MILKPCLAAGHEWLRRTFADVCPNQRCVRFGSYRVRVISVVDKVLEAAYTL